MIEVGKLHIKIVYMYVNINSKTTCSINDINDEVNVPIKTSTHTVLAD